MFGRILTAMVTPFYADGGVNYEGAADLACYLAANGSDGIVVSGTTGEAPALTAEEKAELFRVVRRAAPPACKVVGSVGTNSTSVSVKLAQAAADAGLDGMMAVTPYYNKPSQEGMYRHFRAIAAAAPLPVMLYNIPSRSVVNLLPDTVARLSAVPNIVSLKEATGSIDQMSELKLKLPEDFAIYAGDDALTLPLLALGSSGVVSVASHVVAPQMQSMIAAFKAGDLAGALDWHKKLYPIFKTLFITSNPAPIKFVLESLGHAVGPCRPPLAEPNGQESEQLREITRLIREMA
ncbi:MAG: 4-hydroxy-tetrahydrodipicolinate synthase [Gracilibacteraceae bacterium]|jgi:4-hydroxy-tetrahydrodipicolinate synthase|nr:4-hydroxy-tetrahydrodipicolinate synthase [Gracilibacteraceae bacterium]